MVGVGVPLKEAVKLAFAVAQTVVFDGLAVTAAPGLMVTLTFAGATSLAGILSTTAFTLPVPAVPPAVNITVAWPLFCMVAWARIKNPMWDLQT